MLTVPNQLLSQNPLLSVLERRFINNQGMRGRDGLSRYEKNRAISAATVTSLSGLISFPSMPGYISPNGYAFNPLSTRNFNLKETIQNPSGLDIVVKELFQICSMDYNRAEILGFSANAIKLNKNYVHHTLSELCRQAGVTYDSSLPYEELVTDIVQNLQKTHNLNTVNKQALAQFQQQIPHITQNRNSITRSVVSATHEVNIKGKVSENTLANMAILVNHTANFRLPIIPAAIVKERYLSHSHTKPKFSSTIRDHYTTSKPLSAVKRLEQKDSLRTEHIISRL